MQTRPQAVSLNPSDCGAWLGSARRNEGRRRGGLQPFTVMSCDNLEGNGDVAKRGIVSFARAIDPGLADWIEENGAFPNSMVDRIAPKAPDSESLRLALATGVDDLVPATCEVYTSWVVEERFCAGCPQLELAASFSATTRLCRGEG
jgi:mannitol-1-phosphate/altronate dehydrogenase